MSPASSGERSSWTRARTMLPSVKGERIFSGVVEVARVEVCRRRLREGVAKVRWGIVYCRQPLCRDGARDAWIGLVCYCARVAIGIIDR